MERTQSLFSKHLDFNPVMLFICLLNLVKRLELQENETYLVVLCDNPASSFYVGAQYSGWHFPPFPTVWGVGEY
jgi:hypothetical protein